jgi:predicted nucleic-acid-binding protein
MTTYLLDTNAYIRFLVKDNVSQAMEVNFLFRKIKTEGNKIYLPVFVILETIFVLEKYNKSSREEIALELKRLFALNFFDVENRISFMKCFDAYVSKKSLSIVDILLMYMAKEQNFHFFTFDRKLKKAYETI